MTAMAGGLVLGALFGAFKSKRQGGNGKDMAQYAAGFGILFAVLGLFLAILLARFAS